MNSKQRRKKSKELWAIIRGGVENNMEEEFLKAAEKVIRAEKDISIRDSEIEKLRQELTLVTDHREQALNNAMELMKQNAELQRQVSEWNEANSSNGWIGELRQHARWALGECFEQNTELRRVLGVARDALDNALQGCGTFREKIGALEEIDEVLGKAEV